MVKHKVTEFYDREEIGSFLADHPALAGLRVKGFLLSEDRRAAIIVEPVDSEEEPSV